MGYATQDAKDMFSMTLWGNPEAKWSVSLDGFDGEGVEEKFMNAVSAGTRNPKISVTQWEMAELWMAKGMGSSGNKTIGDVTFYENGKEVPNPWAK